MLIRPPADIRSSEITPQALYRARRDFLKATLAGGLALAAGIGGTGAARAARAATFAELPASPLSTEEPPNSLHDITHYNNFYELGTDKRDPARFAAHLKTRPWSLAVEGECEQPAVYAIEDFVRPHALEERIYRLRCVEGWSMVIPWVGFPLAEVIRQARPTSRAKYVEFTTLHDPKMLPGQRVRVLDWPYVEGLRLDEAMHPLTILAVGLYGEVLPNQNGAPLRLVVPWKYGFKSIKSIVRIRFIEERPVSSWMKAAPREYGFYSNVNPEVAHPRWSQATERRIGEFRKRDTLMFNGYGEQVASLYAGMDLRKHF